MTTNRIDAEAFLVKRLGQHRVAVFEGVTTPEIRRERIRAAILENGLACVIVGRKNGKPEDYASVFERLYGVKLKQSSKAP